MRYCIVDKGIGLARIESEARKLGARNIKKAPLAGQLFCDLEPAAADKLGTLPNIVIRSVKTIKADQFQVYSALQASAASRFWEFRNMFEPPITGSGLTVALLDSGIRKTHIGLRDKVVYEKNFTDSPDCDDKFGHGTSTAFLIAGGEHAPGVECGIAPGAKVMNIKILNDTGVGTDEWLIEGMDECREIFEECSAKMETGEMGYFDPGFLNAVNCSVGAIDDKDPDNPIRLAVDRLYGASPGKFPIFCSAGNGGPTAGTITLPAAARHAWAVGAVTFEPFEIWEHSSRGIVRLSDGTELMKPEMVFYGVNILTAGVGSDEDFVVKTGTSFSAPLALGHLCLYREVAGRYGFLDSLLEMGYEDLETLVYMMSIKPRAAPLTKDSDYGYGMPFGDLMARAMPTAPAVDMESIIGSITPLLAVAMLGMIMVPMAKTVK